MELIDKSVYDQFVAICKNSETFFSADQKMGDSHFRMFSYRLCSYSDWLVHPMARWMRGIMFEVTPEGEFIRVASRPFRKFFNYKENPLVENLLVQEGVEYRADDKMDGSLISTYIYVGERDEKHNTNFQLGLKSKMSLSSEQAVMAMEWINREENEALKDFLWGCSYANMTIDLELISPFNRIVLGYPETKLVILGLRHNLTGEEIDIPDHIKPYAAVSRTVDKAFVDSIPDMLDDIEGYIVHIGGDRLKIKTNKYLKAHAAKDGIGSPKKVIAAILSESIDDVREIFSTDKLLIGMIDQMQELAKTVHNHMVAKIEAFYSENKDLSRKDYAIKAQSVLSQQMSLAMNLYLGKSNDYAGYLMKNFDDYFPESSISFYCPGGVTA